MSGSSTCITMPTFVGRVGLARRDITPPVGIYHKCWGAAKHFRAERVHRPLFVDVVVIAPVEQGAGAPMLRIQLDLLALANVDHAALVDCAARSTGIPRDRIVVTYSHSHAAGWFTPDRKAFPGGELIEPYLERLRSCVADAGRSALLDLQESVLTFGEGWCAVTANRDYWSETDQRYYCGYNPHGTQDRAVRVARVTDKSGSLRATLVHYGCHATTLGWENRAISPDYPGGLREVVEATTGAPCIFLLGPCGDLGPRLGFVGDPAVADANGRQIGFAALEALQGLACIGPPLHDFAYGGNVVSGATLGLWKPASLSPERIQEASRFGGGRFSVDIPLKSRPQPETLQVELEALLARADQAEARGDLVAARDDRAQGERLARWIALLEEIPRGDRMPFAFSVFQMGDAIWLTCGSEPYHVIQTTLQERFTEFRIWVSPLDDNAMLGYLMPSHMYGKGVYAEEPSLFGPGCLEVLIDAMSDRVRDVIARDPS